MELTKRQSDGLKVLCALLVFACHCNETINLAGFIPVSVFFFVSGYGLTFSAKNPLYRVPRLLLLYGFFVMLYSLVAGEIYWGIPSCWFLVLYAVELLAFRIRPSWWFVLLFDFVLMFFFWLGGFSYVWWFSFVAFPFGMFCARSKDVPRFTYHWILSAVLGFVGLIYTKGFPVFGWFFCLPFTVLILNMRNVLEHVSSLAWLTIPFYFVHILLLDMFGVRPDMGQVAYYGQTFGIVLAFLGSVAFSYCIYKFTNVGFSR